MNIDISMDEMTHLTVPRRNSEPLLALLKPHTVIEKCHVSRDQDEIYNAICIEGEFEW